MPAVIISKENAPRYLWGGNCESFVLLNTKGLSVKQERILPGLGEKLHFHDLAQQFFFILSGEATFFVENEIVHVGQNKSIHILSGQKHYIENKFTTVLEFLIISQPSTNDDRINL